MDYTVDFLRWLVQCPDISKNKLFLNAVTADKDTKAIVSQQVLKREDIEYVDGSVQHTVRFTLFDYKSISFNQLVKSKIKSNENILSLLETGALNDWIERQNKEQHFPAYGSKYEVQEIRPDNLTPSAPSIDTDGMLAKYSTPITMKVIEYA